MHVSERLLRIGSTLCAAAALLALACGARAEAARTEHVEAELVAARTAIVPGEPLTVALRLKLARGWHTYWQNPGETGLPTTLAWTLPQGFEAGPIEWPAPTALFVGPLTNYGYEGEVLHLVQIRAPANAAAGPQTLAARADWLVCKETCIPEGADLKLTLPVSPAAADDPRWAAPIAATRASLPRPLTGWHVEASGSGSSIALKVVPEGGNAADPGAVRFFPFESDRIEPSLPQTRAATGRGFALTLPVASTLTGSFARVAGVLTADRGFATAGGIAKAVTIDVPLVGTVAPGPKPKAAEASLDLARQTAGTGIWLAAALALVGGMLLNLMPCVFPVLSLKVLGFARHHDSKATMHAEAIAFASGVLLTFLTLGFTLFILRSAGESLGWGFQLQSPAVVSALAVLFFVIALNLSGVFEFGQLVPSGLAGWTSKNRTLDAFASGVLAVVIASPCTAPFMGAALGLALAGSAATTLLVFGALGLGMALPYVLLASFPAWRRRLPRSGPWLLRVKQVLAFPLYGTVIWLAWVLGSQRDNDAVLRLFATLLAIGFALWAWHLVRTGGARAWAVAAAAILAIGILVGAPLFSSEGQQARATPTLAHGPWDDYSPAKVAELQAAGRTVFVDFTAAWCVTCQVNKRLVLDTAEIQDAFARGKVALLRADWTRRDATITAALAALGRNGVPVYVVYRPGQPPQVLPEILKRQTVLDAIGTG